MGWPEKEAVVQALGLASPQVPGKVQKVELLGYKGELKWKQNEAFLKVEMPAEKISDVAITLKIDLS
jgi:alpha-L-fucosidase